jgi:membrane protease YdiL (CAAX protease family)
MKNDSVKRCFPDAWDVVVMLLLFFAVQIVVGVALGLAGILAPELSPIEGVTAEQFMSEQIALANYNALVYPLLMVCSVVAMWLYVRLRGGRKAVTIRHSISGLNPSVILVGIVWLVASQIVLEPLLALLPPSSGGEMGRGVWAWVTVMVSAPILEELICRGLLYETVRKRWNVAFSIAISAIFFGAIHADWSTCIVAIVAGAIFSILYERTSSILATIIVHSINNALAYALMCFGLGEASFRSMLGGGVAYYVVYVVSVVIFVAASVEAYFRLSKKEIKSK